MVTFIVWAALVFGIGTSILAVILFALLVGGNTIIYDGKNPIELSMAIAILIITILAVVLQTKLLIKGR